jgi:hypothetical protein
MSSTPGGEQPHNDRPATDRTAAEHLDVLRQLGEEYRERGLDELQQHLAQAEGRRDDSQPS